MKKYLLAPALILCLGFSGSSSAGEMFLFDTPVKLPPPLNFPAAVNTTATVSPDGLSIYFTTDRQGSFETWVADRSSLTEPFTNAQRFNGFYHPNMSDDGLSLVMNTSGPSNSIRIATRTNVGELFGRPQSVGSGVNTIERERWASLSPDGLELYFSRNSQNDSEPTDIWVATRPDLSSDFAQAEKLSAVVNLPGTWEDHPTLSPDGMALFFASNRPGGFGGFDIWVSFREDQNSPWQEPENLGPQVNSELEEWAPDMTADSQTLYFARAPVDFTPTEGEIWSAAVVPEPTSVGLMLLGGLFVAMRIRRR